MKQGWEIKKLGDVCIINYGTRVVQKKDGGTTYPVYGGGGATFMIDKYNREDCLVVARFAMSPRCVRFVQGKFFLNDSGLSIESSSPMLSQDLLDKHIIALNDKIYSLGKGAAQKNLDINALKNIDIHFPLSLPEQEKIVSELDCLSGIIEKKRQQLKELDAMAQSIFYEMFGDPVTNEKGWEVKKLGEVAIFKNGLNFKKVETGRKQLFLGVSDFKDKSLISKVDEYSSILIDEEFAEEFLLKDGDIVFVRSNGSKELVGRNVLIYTGNEKIVYSGFCIRCRLMSVDIIPLYANNLLSIPSIKQVIKAFGRGANISNLNQEMLGQIPLPLPPLPLQQTFVSKIESIEKQKGLIKQSIAEVETLLASRMQYYFEEG